MEQTNSTYDLMVKVLKAVQKYIDPNSFIAGGSLSDLEDGKEPNDIDLFFYCGEHTEYWNTKNLIELIFKEEGIEYDLIEKSSGETFIYSTLNNLIRVFNLSVGGHKIQMIQLGTWGNPLTRLSNFPLSTSRIYLALPWEGVIKTPEYKFSKENKVILKMVEGYPEDCPYIGKIKHKFKDYQYVSDVGGLLKLFPNNQQITCDLCL